MVVVEVTVTLTTTGGTHKAEPYTILLLSNPVLHHEDGTLRVDPLTKLPNLFQQAARYAVNVIFGAYEWQAETFLKDLRPSIRIAIAWITDAGVTLDNALVNERPEYGGLLVPARERIRTWVTRHVPGLDQVDVVFALSDSRRYARSTAFGATDDLTSGGIPFQLDGQPRTHHFFCRLPGTVALHVDNQSVEAAHEFGHAASGYQSGYVTDLYTEPCTDCLNVKLGAEPETGIFGEYESRRLRTNAGAGTANSYHCELVDSSVPALMHDFSGHAAQCRHDAITSAHLRARILAKMGR